MKISCYCDRFLKKLLLSQLLSLKLWEVAAGAQQEAFTEERPEKPGVKKAERVADPRDGKARRQRDEEHMLLLSLHF